MPNRLAKEQSPYLLQHAHNPVDWYPWCDEAFTMAKEQNKPVIVSIGYAACHWCHVMERESFEDETIAAFMNTHFINIKVDREEHPDVDHFYMDAVQAITHSGGWPLNVFVTPDRVPFYGGTYFPPKPAYNRISWIDLLQKIIGWWIDKPDEITSQATNILHYLKDATQNITQQNTASIHLDDCLVMKNNLLKQADKNYGGFGHAPKFPSTYPLSFLIQYAQLNNDFESENHALFSVNAMMSGGLYDQIGGGFARYATDEKWLVPHFEKMLYDNALLLITYCDAYLLKQESIHKQVIEDTIAFCNNTWKHKSGIFYSALDADSEGEEGKYYTWSWQDWKEAVKENNEIALEYFGVQEEGNWEGVNILHRAYDFEQLASKHKLNIEEIKSTIQKLSVVLLAKRQQRIPPLTDDKSLLSWNALMNIALVKSATTLNNDKHLLQAKAQMDAMLNAFLKDGKLLHVWKNNEAKITAHLDDYAYLIQALIQLGVAIADEYYLLKAKILTSILIDEFSHESSPMFYFTSSSQTNIPVRKVDLYDGATPSPNAVMAHNLMILGLCFDEITYIARAEAMMQNVVNIVKQYPTSFGYWAMLIQAYVHGFRTIVVNGENRKDVAQALKQKNQMNWIILTSEKEISEVPVLAQKYNSTETAIFVCTMQSCLAPVNTVNEALLLLFDR